ncbi:MAG: HupE/UreJ family protein [Chitinophagaceae bacterium]|nr:HupE/UreJ family protein [Chitinophagaceae bacterium]
MNNLGFYFDLGWHHIIAWGAFDHLLFVLALSAIYLIGNWKQVLILVTAFTIGHSVTLALSVYDLVRANDNWVEFLIPCTIAVTAIFNLMQKDFNPRSLRLNYILALFFGLIHGLGFANAIRFMMAKDQSIGWSLFGFNIGLEAGQIVVVLLILLVSYGVVNKAGLNRKWWVWGLSIFALIMSLKMIWERFPSL